MSVHAADRMIERSISSDEVKSVITNPSTSFPGNKPNKIVAQKGKIRIVYSKDGTIITAVQLEGF